MARLNQSYSPGEARLFLWGVIIYCIGGSLGKGGSDFYPKGVHIFRFVSINITLAKTAGFGLLEPIFYFQYP